MAYPQNENQSKKSSPRPTVLPQVKKLYLGMVAFDYLSAATELSMRGLHIREGTNNDDSFAFRKDSEFTALFSYHISKLDMTGLKTRNNIKWLR